MSYDYESFAAGGCFGPGGVILPASQCGSRAGTTKPAPTPAPKSTPKHTSSTPAKHSTSSSAGCFAAGGEILPASQCKKLGIKQGTQSSTIGAQGQKVAANQKTKPSTSSGGCFAAGGEILPASQCMKYGIPIGTQSQTVTAQGTDVRTGMSISMMMQQQPISQEPGTVAGQVKGKVYAAVTAAISPQVSVPVLQGVGKGLESGQAIQGAYYDFTHGNWIQGLFKLKDVACNIPDSLQHYIGGESTCNSGRAKPKLQQPPGRTARVISEGSDSLFSGLQPIFEQVGANLHGAIL